MVTLTNIVIICWLSCFQNDAAALRSITGWHQLLRPGALPLPAGHTHPGRLHQLHTHRERGAATGDPDQAAVQRAQRRHELRWRQLQLRQSLRAALLWVRSQERGKAACTIVTCISWCWPCNLLELTLTVIIYICLLFSVDTRGAWEEEKEEREEQNCCGQVSQQEEGEDGFPAEGTLQLPTICKTNNWSAPRTVSHFSKRH